MTHSCELYELLDLLEPYAPKKIEELRLMRRETKNGLLSVGLKLHCIDGGPQFWELIDGLGGFERVRAGNGYRRNEEGSICIVLPPVGSAEAAITLLEVLESASCSKIFNNPLVQIQVCSPGRLTPESTALLSIGFYLCSDELRGFWLGELDTTFSELGEDHGWGRRLALYDGGGDLDQMFDWWGLLEGVTPSKSKLPFDRERTDILTATSRNDIRNVNLLSTLCIYADHGRRSDEAYWTTLGEQLLADMYVLLERHLLVHLVDAPWIKARHEPCNGDGAFFAALSELAAYAFDEAARLNKCDGAGTSNMQNGILYEAKSLLEHYRTIVAERARELQ